MTISNFASAGADEAFDELNGSGADSAFDELENRADDYSDMRKSINNAQDRVDRKKSSGSRFVEVDVSGARKCTKSTNGVRVFEPNGDEVLRSDDAFEDFKSIGGDSGDTSLFAFCNQKQINKIVKQFRLDYGREHCGGEGNAKSRSEDGHHSVGCR